MISDPKFNTAKEWFEKLRDNLVETIQNIDEKKFEIATKKINELQDDYVGKIVTLLEKETTFYIAEEYHHKYFSKNPFNAYCFSVIKPKVDKLKSSQK